MRPFNNNDPIDLPDLFFPTLYACRRCWGEQEARKSEGRPRCRHCGIFMLIKDDPNDEVPVLDRMADELLHSGPDHQGEQEHHDAPRSDGGDGG